MSTIKNLIVTRAQINALRDNLDSVCKVGVFKSKCGYGIYFYTLPPFTIEFTEEIRDKTAILNTFNFYGTREIAQGDLYISDRKDLISNYGALMQYVESPARCLNQRRLFGMIYDELHAALPISRDRYPVPVSGWLFNGRSKARYNTVTKPRTVVMHFKLSSNIGILRHYFDEVTGVQDWINIETNTVNLTTIEELTDYILQCMETDLGDNMLITVNNKDTWQSINEKVAVVTADQPITEDPPETNTVPASSPEGSDFLRGLVNDYLKNKRQKVLITLQRHEEDKELSDPLSNRDWDVIFAYIHQERFSEAISALCSIAKIEPDSPHQVFDRATARIGSNSTRFREYARRYFCDAMAQRAKTEVGTTIAYLDSVTAKEIVLTVVALRPVVDC